MRKIRSHLFGVAGFQESTEMFHIAHHYPVTHDKRNKSVYRLLNEGKKIWPVVQHKIEFIRLSASVVNRLVLCTQVILSKAMLYYSLWVLSMINVCLLMGERP